MLKGRSGFITGGAKGIGFACAKTILERGGQVVIVDLAPEDELNQAVAALNHYGPAWGTRADVTDYAAMQQAMAFAVEKMGKVDAAVNSAGGGGGGNIYDEDPEPFIKVVELCLFGVFHAMKLETMQMIKQGGGGSIVNISSINSTVPYYMYGAYCAAKAGIESLSSCAAMEVGKHKIRINSICPGFTNTTLIAGFTANPAVTKEVMDHTPLLRYPPGCGDHRLCRRGGRAIAGSGQGQDRTNAGTALGAAAGRGRGGSRGGHGPPL